MPISDWSSDVCSSDLRQIAFSVRFGPLLRATSNNPGGGTPFSRQSNLDIKSGAFIPADDKRMRYQKANEQFHSDGYYRVVPALCRSEERRVGKACVGTGRTRWSPDH